VSAPRAPTSSCWGIAASTNPSPPPTSAARRQRAAQGLGHGAHLSGFGPEAAPGGACLRRKRPGVQGDGKSAAALFRFGDGALIDSSLTVRAGVYYLVTSRPDDVPEQIVKERGPHLDDHGFESTEVGYAIFAVDLPPNYELPELSIKTRGAAAAPRLEFADATDIAKFGANVFVERPPRLHLVNWNADCDGRYWLWVSDGAQERLTSAIFSHPSRRSPRN
jgi:hypothetical protein